MKHGVITYLFVISVILSACGGAGGGGSNNSGSATPSSRQLTFYASESAVTPLVSDNINALVNATVNYSIYLKNTGTSLATNLNLAFSSSVAGLTIASTTCGTSLESNAECRINLNFNPPVVESGNIYLKASFVSGGQSLWSGLLINYQSSLTPTVDLGYCSDPANCYQTRESLISFSVAVGSQVSGKFYLENFGNSIANNITYTNSLPTGMSLVSNSCGNSLNANSIPCEVDLNFSPSLAESGVASFTTNYNGTQLNLAINYQANALPSTQWVLGWPNYVAQGTITSFIYTSPESPPPFSGCGDSLFTYNGEGANGINGYVIESPYKIFDLFSSSYMNQITQCYPSANPNPMLPVLVEYVINLSGSDVQTANNMLQNQNQQLSASLFNLVADSYFLIKANPRAANGVSGTLLLNPDALGFIQQRSVSLPSFVPNKEALSEVLCMAESTFSINGQCRGGGWESTLVTGFTGPAFDLYYYLESHNDYQKGAYQTAADWASCMNQYVLKQCYNNKTYSNQVPINITDDFPGFIQAQNWLISYFGQNKIVYGWHENISALPNTVSWWTQTQYADSNLRASGVQATFATPVSQFLNNLKVFNGAYIPDFIYFDRYGSDDYYLSAETSLKHQNALYNANSYANYFTGIKQVSEEIAPSGKSFLPVMIWQMTGNHIYANNETNPSPLSMGSLPDYLFGDSNLNYSSTSGLTNMASWISTNIGALNIDHTYYPICGSTCDELQFLNLPLYTGGVPYNWTTSNIINELPSYHVFAVMWGASGGPGGSAVGIVPLATGQANDNGWLANKMQTYYTNPVGLP